MAKPISAGWELLIIQLGRRTEDNFPRYPTFQVSGYSRIQTRTPVNPISVTLPALPLEQDVVSSTSTSPRAAEQPGTSNNSCRDMTWLLIVSE